MYDCFSPDTDDVEAVIERKTTQWGEADTSAIGAPTPRYSGVSQAEINNAASSSHGNYLAVDVIQIAEANLDQEDEEFDMPTMERNMALSSFSGGHTRDRTNSLSLAGVTASESCTDDVEAVRSVPTSGLPGGGLDPDARFKAASLVAKATVRMQDQSALGAFAGDFLGTKLKSNHQAISSPGFVLSDEEDYLQIGKQSATPSNHGRSASTHEAWLPLGVKSTNPYGPGGSGLALGDTTASSRGQESGSGFVLTDEEDYLQIGKPSLSPPAQAMPAHASNDDVEDYLQVSTFDAAAGMQDCDGTHTSNDAAASTQDWDGTEGDSAGGTKQAGQSQIT